MSATSTATAPSNEAQDNNVNLEDLAGDPPVNGSTKGRKVAEKISRVIFLEACDPDELRGKLPDEFRDAVGMVPMWVRQNHAQHPIGLSPEALEQLPERERVGERSAPINEKPPFSRKSNGDPLTDARPSHEDIEQRIIERVELLKVDRGRQAHAAASSPSSAHGGSAAVTGRIRRLPLPATFGESLRQVGCTAFR